MNENEKENQPKKCINSFNVFFFFSSSLCWFCCNVVWYAPKTSHISHKNINTIQMKYIRRSYSAQVLVLYIFVLTTSIFLGQRFPSLHFSLWHRSTKKKLARHSLVSFSSLFKCFCISCLWQKYVKPSFNLNGILISFIFWANQIMFNVQPV